MISPDFYYQFLPFLIKGWTFEQKMFDCFATVQAIFCLQACLTEVGVDFVDSEEVAVEGDVSASDLRQEAGLVSRE